MSGAREVFSAEAPLRRGITVLEASAGTGKTFQISTQVARLVAEEGVSIDRILVVTFTRAATEELVDRVRDRLAQALVAVRGSAEDCAKDQALTGLWTLAQGDKRVEARLHDALRRFDEATITTIHGFCQRVLQQNAFESLADCEVELLTDDAKMQEELRADILARLRHDADAPLRAFLDAPAQKGGCGLAQELPKLLRTALHHPDAALVPEESAGVLVQGNSAHHLELPADPEARAQLAGRVRADVARYARKELTLRAQARRVQTFDDLLRKLAASLGPKASPQRRQRLTEVVQQRYTAALIDEFQDTDRVQWTIFSTLFGGPAHFLYLIGDPKQAIYGFRGANVHVYLEAVRTAGAGRVFTMDRNFRSDARLVDALNHVWGRPGVFGSEQIAYVQVEAEHAEDRLLAPERWPPEHAARASLQLCFFDGGLVEGGAPEELLNTSDLTQALAERVAEDVTQTLQEGWRHTHGGPLGPSDLAILVRSHFQAERVQAALSARGVPSVRSGAASVFASEQAAHMQAWLTAVLESGRDGPARRCAVTPWFGWTALDLAGLGVEDPDKVRQWDQWLSSLARSAVTVERRGFMVALRATLSEQAVLPRLLRVRDGERQVTNLLHLAELVHGAQQADRLSLPATLAWLADQRARAEADEAGEAELRLERDDAAVRILTMHKSKGLQFPVVFVPFLWDGRRLRDSHPLVVPQPQAPSRRVLCTDVVDGLEPRSSLLVAAEQDAAEEAMRLAYVALTRARHRCFVYGGPYKGKSWGYDTSPLAGLLHGHSSALQGPVEGLWAEVQHIAGSAPVRGGLPTVAARRCGAAALTPWTPMAASKAPVLVPRRYRRGAFDAAWRVHSYSSLTRGHYEELGLEPDPGAERGGGDDAPRVVRPDAPEAQAADAEDVPLASFVAGPQAGTFLHEVLERVDFWPTPEDPERKLALQETIAALSPRYGFTGLQTAGLAQGLTEALHVPLGGPLKTFRLVDLSRRDRLDELRFDLSIVRVRGPDFWQAFTLGQGGGGLSEAYLESLRRLNFEALAGFLTGSIDLVFREQGRWYVVDYKSNRIDPDREGRSPLEHYTQPYLQQEMERHHYLLQAYLYALALHRFLAHRLGDAYTYESHFGGVAYLFLRGMTQADLPMTAGHRPGIFHLRPDARVLNRLDALFRGEGGSQP